MIALLLETDKTDVLEDQGTRVPMIARLVDAAARHAGRVVLIAAVAAIVASVYTARYFAIDTETSKLISPELPWRQREITFDAAFPQRVDLIAIVVDAATPGIIEWHDLRDRTERRVQEDHLSVFAHDAHDGEKESREDSK